MIITKTHMDHIARIQGKTDDRKAINFSKASHFDESSYDDTSNDQYVYTESSEEISNDDLENDSSSTVIESLKSNYDHNVDNDEVTSNIDINTNNFNSYSASFI